MFEKEAEEYKDTYFGFADERISEVQDFEGNYIDISERIMKTFIDGAEFGYNKANEWHYPSKGELPENNKLCLIQMKTGTFEIAYRVTDLCWKYKNTTFSCSFQSEIYAWKEIVLPELKESE